MAPSALAEFWRERRGCYGIARGRYLKMNWKIFCRLLPIAAWSSIHAAAQRVSRAGRRLAMVQWNRSQRAVSRSFIGWLGESVLFSVCASIACLGRGGHQVLFRIMFALARMLFRLRRTREGHFKSTQIREIKRIRRHNCCRLRRRSSDVPFPFPTPVAHMAVSEGRIAAVVMTVGGKVVPPDSTVRADGDKFGPPRIAKGKASAVDDLFVLLGEDEDPAWSGYRQAGIFAWHLWKAVDDIDGGAGVRPSIEVYTC